MTIVKISLSNAGSLSHTGYLYVYTTISMDTTDSSSRMRHNDHWYEQQLTFFHQLVLPGKSYRRGSLSTVHLLVLTGLDQLLFI